MSYERWKIPANLGLNRHENQLFLSALADYPEAVRLTTRLYDYREVKEQISNGWPEDSLDTSNIYPNELEWTTDWHIEWYDTNLRNESVGQEWGLIDPADIGPYWYLYPHTRTHVSIFDSYNEDTCRRAGINFNDVSVIWCSTHKRAYSHCQNDPKLYAYKVKQEVINAKA